MGAGARVSSPSAPRPASVENPGAGVESTLADPSAVPADQLLDVCREMAREIAGNPPLAVRNIKRLLQEQVDLAQVVRHESESNAGSIDSEDRREALRAYVEKRPPRFADP